LLLMIFQESIVISLILRSQGIGMLLVISIHSSLMILPL